MFGFGKSKSYLAAVWAILNELKAVEYLPSMAPLNSEIEKSRLNNFSEHEAALLLCFSSALSIAAADNLPKAQALYDLARDAQPVYIRNGYVNEEDVNGFNKYIAENSEIVARL
jgi:hypothetical protein